MVCQPCHIIINHSYAEYIQWITGERLAYQARQNQRVQCLDCGADMVARYLAAHFQMQHFVSHVAQWENNPPPLPPIIAQLFPVSRMTGPMACTVEG